jgi:hypothetical protein
MKTSLAAMVRQTSVQRVEIMRLPRLHAGGGSAGRAGGVSGHYCLTKFQFTVISPVPVMEPKLRG